MFFGVDFQLACLHRFSSLVSFVFFCVLSFLCFVFFCVLSFFVSLLLSLSLSFSLFKSTSGASGYLSLWPATSHPQLRCWPWVSRACREEECIALPCTYSACISKIYSISPSCLTHVQLPGAESHFQQVPAPAIFRVSPSLVWSTLCTCGCDVAIIIFCHPEQKMLRTYASHCVHVQ